LTPEEKLVRRKLKNRVAAQTARDRKKARMSELEDMIVALECKNKQLQAENDELRRSAETLVDENKDLRHRLEASPTDQQTVNTDIVPASRKLSDPDTGSAVLDTPLPQETGRTSLQLAAAYFLACMIIWATTNCSDSSKSSSGKISSGSSSLRSTTSLSPARRAAFPTNLQALPLLEWWGRHQQNWNPLMN
jgi:X box-binding protein 1